MFVILGISFVSLYFCLCKAQKKRIEIWMDAVIAWCVLLFAKTEIMSLFGEVNFISCLLFWFVVITLAIAALS